MICDRCKKKEATVHVKEVIGSKIVSLDLCQECAASQGLASNDESHQLDLATLIYNLTAEALKNIEGEKDAEPVAADEEGVTRVRCPECGCSEEDVKQTGKLGCPTCYAVFNESVRGALKAMHRGTHHVGKSPVPAALPAEDGSERLWMKRLAGMHEELARAVATEAYERAAELRDEISRAKAVKK